MSFNLDLNYKYYDNNLNLFYLHLTVLLLQTCNNNLNYLQKYYFTKCLNCVSLTFSYYYRKINTIKIKFVNRTDELNAHN